MRDQQTHAATGKPTRGATIPAELAAPGRQRTHVRAKNSSKRADHAPESAPVHGTRTHARPTHSRPAYEPMRSGKTSALQTNSCVTHEPRTAGEFVGSGKSVRGTPTHPRASSCADRNPCATEVINSGRVIGRRRPHTQQQWLRDHRHERGIGRSEVAKEHAQVMCVRRTDRCGRTALVIRTSSAAVSASAKASAFFIATASSVVITAPSR